jgi:CRP-like cAMP-binding protein
MAPTADPIIRRHGRHFAPGEAVFLEGEPAQEMFLVHLGRVRIMKAAPGGPVCLEVIETGDFFGEKGLLAGTLRAVSAVADQDTWLVALDGDTLQRILRDQPDVARRIIERLAARLESLEGRLIGLITRSEGVRMAEALIEFGRERAQGASLVLDAALLASRAGVLLGSAERALAALERAGVLARDEQGRLGLRAAADLEDYLEYSALKQDSDPLALEELAGLSGLGLREVEILAERVIRRRLSLQESDDGRRTLCTPWQRYLELKLRFEFSQPPAADSRGTRREP